MWRDSRRCSRRRSGRDSRSQSRQPRSRHLQPGRHISQTAKNPMKVLVTGGAGYIGSGGVERLISHNHNAVVYDNLSKGHIGAIAPEAVFVEGDLLERDKLLQTLERHRIDAVIHLAASSLVGESVENPHLYFTNNITAGITLLDAMLSCGVKRLVFSSTAAVYGAPEIIPITEDAPQSPTNPYGESKLAFERMLHCMMKPIKCATSACVTSMPPEQVIVSVKIIIRRHT